MLVGRIIKSSGGGAPSPAFLADWTDTCTGGGDQFGVRFGNDGTLRHGDPCNSPRYTFPSGEWWVAGASPGIGASYEALITENSHTGDDNNIYGGLNIATQDNVAGLNGTWRSIGNSFEVSFGRFANEGSGSSNCNFTVQIRDDTTLEVVATATFDFTYTII